MTSAWLWLRRFCWRRWNRDIEDDLQMFWCRHGGYRLALWIDKRRPGWCWADICLNLGMARGLTHWRETARESGPSCKRESETDIGTCWCGKFRDLEQMDKFQKELEARNAQR